VKAIGLVQLDKYSLVPNTLFINDIDSSFYTVNYGKGTLQFTKKVLQDSVTITYRTFPFSFNAPFRRFNYDSVRNHFIAKQPALFNRDGVQNNGLFNFGTGITYSGSFGRSLSFGNSQDAVFNSQLNLQLSGYIGDSIEIAVAITDNNIPIQPDGTTKQLNEFDRVLLFFRKKNWELSLGDIDLRQNKSYYLNFFKRLQGISYVEKNRVGEEGYNKITMSGAVAKGKFTRNVFQGQEGNQGPYKLQGANNELYFVVLGNTEHVFIDGEQLQRGEDQAYIINYNTAEITFTPKRMITKDKRIQVEFEYADRNFLNSLLYVNDEMQVNKRLNVSIGVYHDADAKNSPINQNLDSAQTRFLANLGDSTQNAYYPVATIDTFSANRIMYAKVLLTGTNDSIYQYSTNRDSAHYLLNFVEVGVNKGNYIPLFNGANGKVYQYVSPVSGIAQGNFEPASFLVTPKKQQLINVSTTYAINPTMILQTDVAMSNYDANTFSSKDKNNNKGLASRFLITHSGHGILFNKQLYIVSNAGYEYVDQYFKPIERLHTVEFTRDWGLPLSTTSASEHLPSLGIEVKDKGNNFFKYTSAGYIRSDNYKGFRQTLEQNLALNSWQLKAEVSLTNNTSILGKGYYFKPRLDVNKTIKALNYLIVGGSYSVENNTQQVSGSDSLNANSFYFDVVTAYIKSNLKKHNKWAFTYTTRSDKQAYHQLFLQIDRSNNYNFLYDLVEHKSHHLHLNLSYRQLNVFNTNITNLTPDHTFLGRVEYSVNALKGFIAGSTIYEVGAGQEQQRDITYIQVPAGKGQYTWIDYNHDGIQQLNEFEIAQFSDQATYVRIYTPTNVYVKSDYTLFNYSLLLNPRVIANKIANRRCRNFISRLSVQSSLQTNKKVLAQSTPVFNPFEGKIADTALITLGFINSNTFSFNRFSSKWGIDITKLVNYHKNLLTYGAQSTQLNEWTLKGRLSFNRQYTIELLQKLGSNTQLTPAFNNQNYTLKTISTEPKFSFIQGSNYRLQLSYQYLLKQNAVEYGGEKSISNALTLETKYNSIKQTSITGKFTYNNLSYNGTTNTAVSYVMLDGLLAGKNYLWTIDYTKRLINNLEISFSYEGRKPGDSKVINIGRASLRAIL